MGIHVYEAIEVFGGCGSIAKAFGVSCVFDVRRDSNDNIHTAAGLLRVCEMMVETKAGGLAMMEPTCSSFTRFVTAHTTKRTEDWCEW